MTSPRSLPLRFGGQPPPTDSVPATLAVSSHPFWGRLTVLSAWTPLLPERTSRTGAAFSRPAHHPRRDTFRISLQTERPSAVDRGFVQPGNVKNAGADRSTS